MSMKLFCDACGEEMEPQSGHGAWEITMRFVSFWNPKGDERIISLCSGCGYQAAWGLGFQYDTGKILSRARGEMIDGVSVCGPNGGGIMDIAMNGMGGASPARWHAEAPDALVAGCLVRKP